MSGDVAEWKKQVVSDLSSKLEKYDVVGIVNIEGIPAKQFQEMRANLRNTANIKVSRNTLMRHSLDSSKKDGSNELKNYTDGQVAFLLSNENPFKLAKIIEESRTKAPASSGDIAPQDITVEKGPTSLEPGPVLSDLQRAGIPAGIEGGDVVIQETEVVKEEGEEISSILADMLGKLGIKPIEVGMSLKAILEDGVIFDADDLDIDIDEYIQDLAKAKSNSISMAIGISYPNKHTIKKLVWDGYNKAKSLGVETNIANSDTIDRLLSKAKLQAESLSSQTSKEFMLNES